MDWKSILPSLIALVGGYTGAAFQFKGMTRGSDVDLSKEVRESVKDWTKFQDQYSGIQKQLTSLEIKLATLSKENISIVEENKKLIDKNKGLVEVNQTLVEENKKLVKKVTDLTDAFNFLNKKQKRG
ncbi:hypothetical protein [Companilactobacillus metriopterae]|uniref:hypothetical protein n=1 Tax=Companilactobacillus metriopterae TaxID=1909267 RepID=UPI00100B87BD|nr:hypothetical protein [Companilactobacillus metriopterae]